MLLHPFLAALAMSAPPAPAHVQVVHADAPEAVVEFLAARLREACARAAPPGHKELAEETGIRLRAEDLVDLTVLAQTENPHLTSYDEVEAAAIRGKALPDRGMYPSAGGCNEFLRLMFHERTVTREELDAMRGKCTGNLEEGEAIVLDIIRYDLLWRVCSDAKALSSMLLFERLRAAGKI
jgi:ADP-sugar diphosphatase